VKANGALPRAVGPRKISLELGLPADLLCVAKQIRHRDVEGVSNPDQVAKRRGTTSGLDASEVCAVNRGFFGQVFLRPAFLVSQFADANGQFSDDPLLGLQSPSSRAADYGFTEYR
jgi:hypothetical protein